MDGKNNYGSLLTVKKRNNMFGADSMSMNSELELPSPKKVLLPDISRSSLALDKKSSSINLLKNGDSRFSITKKSQGRVAREQEEEPSRPSKPFVPSELMFSTFAPSTHTTSTFQTQRSAKFSNDVESELKQMLQNELNKSVPEPPQQVLKKKHSGVQGLIEALEESDRKRSGKKQPSALASEKFKLKDKSMNAKAKAEAAAKRKRALNARFNGRNDAVEEEVLFNPTEKVDAIRPASASYRKLYNDLVDYTVLDRDEDRDETPSTNSNDKQAQEQNQNVPVIIVKDVPTAATPAAPTSTVTATANGKDKDNDLYNKAFAILAVKQGKPDQPTANFSENDESNNTSNTVAALKAKLPKREPALRAKTLVKLVPFALNGRIPLPKDMEFSLPNYTPIFKSQIRSQDLYNKFLSGEISIIQKDSGELIFGPGGSPLAAPKVFRKMDSKDLTLLKVSNPAHYKRYLKMDERREGNKLRKKNLEEIRLKVLEALSSVKIMEDYYLRLSEENKTLSSEHKKMVGDITSKMEVINHDIETHETEVARIRAIKQNEAKHASRAYKVFEKLCEKELREVEAAHKEKQLDFERASKEIVDLKKFTIDIATNPESMREAVKEMKASIKVKKEELEKNLVEVRKRCEEQKKLIESEIMNKFIGTMESTNAKMAAFFKENTRHLDNKKQSLHKEIAINKELQIKLAQETEVAKAENEALQKEMRRLPDKRRDVLSYKKFMTCQPDEEIIVCQD